MLRTAPRIARCVRILALAMLLNLPALADSTAFKITDPADLLTGTTAQAAVGDFKMANDFIEIIIDDIPNPHGFANTGGNIIDAIEVGGEDRFASLFTIFDAKFGRQADYDTLTVVNAGGGAATAHIRVSGVDSDDPDVAVITDYFLAPTDTYLTVTTTMTNNGSEDILSFQVGDAIQWGLTTHFAPGWDNDNRNIPGDGYDIGGVVLDVAWVAGNGQGSSYGYTIPAGTMDMPNGSSWSDPNVKFLDMPAGGGSDSYTRFFIIGDGSISSISDLVFSLNSTTTGTLSGTVTEAGTANPIDGATVAITTGQCLGTNGAVSYTLARSDAAGSYNAQLEPGTYQVLFQKDGRNDSSCQTVSISAGGNTVQNGTLDPAGVLAWTVTESGSGIALPAKLSLLNTPVSPDWDGPDLGDASSLAGGYAILSPTGAGSLEVPPGNYELWISRGTEYDVSVQPITITAGVTTNVNAALLRSVDSTGWISSDLHVHAANSFDSGVTFETRIQQSAAEGLEYPVATDHDYHSDMTSAITSTGLTSWVGTMPGNELTTNDWGHFNAYPVTVNTGALRNGAPDWIGLTPSGIFGALRADLADPVVQLNHPRAGGIGYFDLTSINPVTGESPDPNYSTDYDAVEVFNGKRLTQVLTVKNDWYHLLNNGERVTGLGNTDTHKVFGQEMGYPRNFIYLQTDDPSAVTASTFRDAVRDGRVFFTNGPFVEFWVDGNLPSDVVTNTGGLVDVRVRIQAPDWVVVDTADIIVNGQVVRTLAVPDTGTALRIDTTETLSITDDSWVAVEVRGGNCEVDSSNNCLVGDCPGRLDPVVPPLFGTDPVCPFAHTNPVYVDTDGNGSFDAPGNRGTLVEPIADVRPVDAGGVHTRLNETVTVRGIATSPSFVFDRRSNLVYFQDDSIDFGSNLSGGMATFQNGLIKPEIELGDFIEVTGNITQFFGLTELTDLSIAVLDENRPVPDPLLVTVADLRSFDNDEQFEGMLVRINDVSIQGGSWPSFGETQNITIGDSSTASTITMRLVDETDIDGSAAPSGSFDLIAPVGQFKFAAPFLGFYQLLPRERFDIIEPGDATRILHGPASFPVTSCGATIHWYTNQLADGLIEYGLSDAYGTNQSVPGISYSHTGPLTNLSPNTQYFYRVTSDGVSSTGSFTTTAGPNPQIIEGPTASRIDPNTVQIRWTTDVPADSTVHYGFTDAYGLSASGPTDTTHHVVTLSGLAVNEDYAFEIASSATTCGGGSSSGVTGSFDTFDCQVPCVLPSGDPAEVSPRNAVVPFTVDRLTPGGSTLRLSFEAQGGDVDYTLYTAQSRAAIDAGAYQQRFCDLENNPEGSFNLNAATSTITFDLDESALLTSGNLLIVADRFGTEGPYGFDSIGLRRPSDADQETLDDRGCTPVGMAGPLFFSEYIEGSSNNKALEIFNAGTLPVDLAAGSYTIEMTFNANTTPFTTIPLSGVVPAGGTFVLAQSNANASILGVADQTNGGSWYNGNDTVVLLANGVVVDSIGQIGGNVIWGSGSVTTQNDTLRRQCGVTIGDMEPNDAYDPTLEWDGFPQDTTSDLGQYVCP